MMKAWIVKHHTKKYWLLIEKDVNSYKFEHSRRPNTSTAVYNLKKKKKKQCYLNGEPN